MAQIDCLSRVRTARVARLATTAPSLQPHLVPVTFTLQGDDVVIGIDQKPKSTLKLRRLRNIQDNPLVSILWDQYSEDWSELWWVRGDGRAEVVDDGERWSSAIASLTAKYVQYRTAPPQGPVIAITQLSWSGWSFSE
jgi:PPOX class probable F420-dependent enzyme